MQTENLKCFFVWYVMTCRLTTYRASRNRFSTISFHWLFVLLWNIPGPFLDQNNSWYNFKPSCSLLALRASWLAWRLYRFYQLNKSRCCCRCKCDVTIENLTRAIFEKQSTALHVVRIIIFLSGICLLRWQKCGPRPKLFLRLDKFSTLVDHIILTYLCKSIIPGYRIKKAC